MKRSLVRAVSADGETAAAYASGGRLPQDAEYGAPIIVFGLLTFLESYLPATIYPLAYSIKIAAVTAVLFWARGSLSLIRPTRRVVAPAVFVGLVVFAQWVVLDKLVPYPHFGTRVAFNPFSEMHSVLGISAFLAVRLIGLIAVVPVMEETFWRGFLLRYLTSDGGDWRRLDVGTFSIRAFTIVTAIFAAAHPEWLVALVAGAAYAWLLRSTRSLFAATLAHAVTNAALGAYVLAAADWYFW